MVRWKTSAVLAVMCAVLFSACTNTNTGGSANPNPTATSPALLSWDTNPNAVIFRLDRTLNGESTVSAHNRLPLCTLFGNGHLVWVNSAPPNGEQILEAQLDASVFRSFLDFL